uniref:Uncharacterized protein n=1 Tax=Romanomermis culicivorax TaxID=13658 RepID=A0A915IPC2_ROMCU
MCIRRPLWKANFLSHRSHCSAATLPNLMAAALRFRLLYGVSGNLKYGISEPKIAGNNFTTDDVSSDISQICINNMLIDGHFIGVMGMPAASQVVMLSTDHFNKKERFAIQKHKTWLNPEDLIGVMGMPAASQVVMLSTDHFDKKERFAIPKHSISLKIDKNSNIPCTSNDKDNDANHSDKN